MTRSKVRVALVGCGQIADAHLQEIRRIPLAEPVAVCDRVADLARQASARFGVPGVYSDLGRMLDEARPDVLHITTPPQTHRPIALQALTSGAHLYVEKPFTLDVAEADEVLDAARAAGRLVCVGHDQLFDPVWLECRRRVDAGEFGAIVHVDSVQGYDLSGPFGRVFMSEPDHWTRRLPGGLFQNVMSHAMYRITEFLTDERPKVWATWFGDRDGGPPTELRVLLQGAEVSATLMFSSKTRPVQRLVRLHGTRQGLEVDLDGRVLRRQRALAMPGAFAKVEAPLRHLGEAFRSSAGNFGQFLRSELHYFAGMRTLFESLYQAILNESDSPIPPGEIRRVTALMDTIFAECRRNEPVPGAGGTGAPMPGSRAAGAGLVEGVRS
jgi:predicted dehydrogenase